jgi:hypothetical protein
MEDAVIEQPRKQHRFVENHGPAISRLFAKVSPLSWVSENGPKEAILFLKHCILLIAHERVANVEVAEVVSEVPHEDMKLQAAEHLFFPLLDDSPL